MSTYETKSSSALVSPFLGALSDEQMRSFSLPLNDLAGPTVPITEEQVKLRSFKALNLSMREGECDFCYERRLDDRTNLSFLPDDGFAILSRQPLGEDMEVARIIIHDLNYMDMLTRFFTA